MVMQIFSILFPVLLHMILSDAAAILLPVLTRGQADTAVCTTVAALLVIPAAVWMYRRDAVKSVIRKDAKKTGKSTENVHITHVKYGMLCMILGGVMDLIWSEVLVRIQIQNYFSNQTQEQLLASAAAVQIIGLGIAVPIAEELIFRGLMYNRMKQLFSVPMSIFLTSLLFALYHGNMIQILFAFPLAVILAWIYEKGKWFGYPALFHMGVNLTTVIINLLFI